MDDEEYTIIKKILNCFLIVILCLVAINILQSDANKARIEIKKSIAAEYNFCYSTEAELDRKVKFYRHAPTYRTFSDCKYTYVIDGVEYIGYNSEINEQIQYYVNHFMVY